MNGKRCKVTALVLTAAILLGILSGCSMGKSGDTLVVAYDYFSGKFSPFFADTSYDRAVASMTQLNLLPSDREGNILLSAREGQTVPYNGTDYTYYGAANCEITENQDGTVDYDLSLREDIAFSDGTLLTADDVIFSLYVYCDPTYDGSTTLYSRKIVGMTEYRQGMDTLLNLLQKAGRDNTDFTHWSEATQKAFWTDVDQAGAKMAQEIVDYCIAAGQAENVAQAAEVWGYAGLPEEATAADFFARMLAEHRGDLAAVSGKNAGTPLFEQLAYYDGYQQWVTTGDGAANISGIVKTGRHSLRITLEGVDPAFIYQLNMAVAPMHYYGDRAQYDYENDRFGFPKGDLSLVREKTTRPMGAGPYRFVSYENNVVSLQANESYVWGAPKITNLKMQGVSTSDKMTGMTTDLFDITVPAYNDDDIAAIRAANSNGELSGDKLTTVTTDYLGYGYIGICADTVKVGEDKASEESKALRRALATLMAVHREPVVYAYYGDRASIIQYPISNTSWAAPRPSDEGYVPAYCRNADEEIVITADMTQEEKAAAAKQAAISLFAAAGYTYEEASGKFTAAPEGAAMQWECIIPAGGVGDHPSYGILTETKNVLQGLGMDLIIRDPSDANALWDAQDAGTCQLWAAAWAATPDPDLYQIYHSANVIGLEGSSNSNKYGIQDPVLDTLIMEARSTTNQAFRKATYKEALEVILAWGVELPVYQRQEATLFSTERVNIGTIPADMTPFYGWAAEIHTLELN